MPQHDRKGAATLYNFRDDADRRRWCEWPARTVEVCRWRLHALLPEGRDEHLFGPGEDRVRGGSDDLVAPPA